MQVKDDCKAKVQDIGFDKFARKKFETLDSTKVQDKGALHIKHIGRARRHMTGCKVYGI